MNNMLYNKILKSIGNEIKSAVNEQFNIGNMNLNGRMSKSNMNIFNKNILNIDKIFNALSEHDPNNVVSTDDIKMLNDDSFTSIYKVKSRNTLVEVIDYYSAYYPDDSLNWLDVSEITDMTELFIYTYFNGNISDWNVSNVTNMENMFFNSSFNNDISKWDVSNVTNMESAFRYSGFNNNISDWDISNVTNMKYMFEESKFNQNISGWDVSNVKNYDNIFYNCHIKEEYKPIKFR